MIEAVASLANLTAALHHCRRGKRYSQGYQAFLLHMPTNLLEMSQELLTHTYRWSSYRSFYVCDPKRRQILAAPFRDRIVHQGIHQVIGPLIDRRIPRNSYACRQGMGNRHAALRLLAILKALGPDRYSVKLDVSQYFFSINHRRLLAMLEEVIPSPTLMPLLESLLKSHGPFGRKGVGIPIGNVTSQAFANLYLSPIDHLAADRSDVFYVRYMDDMIVTGRDKGTVQDFAALIRTGVASDLKLQIPLRKCMPLGSDPVPFLGYVINHTGYRSLRRNERRHKKRVGRMRRQMVGK